MRVASASLALVVFGLCWGCAIGGGGLGNSGGQGVGGGATVRIFSPESKKDKMRKTVVLMDSHIKDVVYCPHTQKIGGSNADDIINLIKDLPLHIETVSTNLEWQDDHRVIDLDPALIVLHASAFYEATRPMEGNARLLDFLHNLEKTNIKILVYTRGLPDQPTEDILVRWKKITEGLKNNKNAQLFKMPKGKEYDSCFEDPDVGRPFKRKIREILELK
jgi:hypothetical protein